MNVIITHGPMDEEMNITWEYLAEKWSEFNQLRLALEAYPPGARVSGERGKKIEENRVNIQIARLEFHKAFQKADGHEGLLLIQEILAEMRENAIEKARRKSNTHRDTFRALGEADALDELDSLLTEIFKAGHNIDE